MKKISIVIGGLLLSFLPCWGQLQKNYEYGVIPTENITSLELNPVLDVLDDSGSISTGKMTFKGYRIINAHWNWGAEVPLARYESPAKSVNGLGDILAAITWVDPSSVGYLGTGAKMELSLPTATDKRLGSGKLQAMPSVFVVWQLSENWYTAAAYKHHVSVIGNDNREDINFGRFRLNISYLSANQWWIQTNAYYYQDYRHSGKAELVPEVEIGTLVNHGTALYINGSTHAGGNWHSKDWSIGTGFKILYL